MDMSTTDKSDKRRPSALEVLDRFKPEDPVERVKRLQKEIMELRAACCAPKACLRKPGAC